MKYKVVIPPLVEQIVRVLPPTLKNQIRAGLEAIQEDPYSGKLLKEELRGLRSYRVNRYRIVYRVVSHRVEIQIIDLGPRTEIYDRVLSWVRRFSS